MVRRTLVIALLLALLALPAGARPDADRRSPAARSAPLPNAAPTRRADARGAESNDSLTSDLGGRTTLY